jgi:hypothetical protein
MVLPVDGRGPSNEATRREKRKAEKITGRAMFFVWLHCTFRKADCCEAMAQNRLAGRAGKTWEMKR